MTIDTARLRSLAQAATPGPWWVGWGDGSGASSIVAREHEDALGLRAIVVMGGDHDGVDMGVTSPADAAYIAALDPATVLALLAALAAIPADPWLLDRARACYACLRAPREGHHEGCAWQAAMAALGGEDR